LPRLYGADGFSPLTNISMAGSRASIENMRPQQGFRACEQKLSANPKAVNYCLQYEVIIMKNVFISTISELVVVLVTLGIILLIVNNVFPTYRRYDRCAVNLKGIGTAFMLYMNDYEGQMPVTWSRDAPVHTFGRSLYNKPNETKITRWANPNFSDWDNQGSVGANLYLLVRFEDMVPKMFLCPSSRHYYEMDLYDAIDVCDENGWPQPKNYSDLNDFQSMRNLSYSMNDPWAVPLNDHSPANLVVMADKSNAYDTDTGRRNRRAKTSPHRNRDDSWDDNDGKNRRHGNSANHDTQYQNVLFMDGSVKKCDQPTVGIAQDNIYTYWSGGANSAHKQKTLGRWDKNHAQAAKDSYLGN